MIVRIMGEGQWRVDDEQLERLNDLDAKVEGAVEAGDEPTFEAALEALLLAVREAGVVVGVEELVDSDLILPPADSSLDDVRSMLSDDGLIPG